MVDKRSVRWYTSNFQESDQNACQPKMSERMSVEAGNVLSHLLRNVCASFQESTDSAIADLERRIISLEAGIGYDATKEAVQKVEYEFLMKLRKIRAALQEEGSAVTGSKEVETLKLENELLRKRNAKLEYRVQHVVANLEEMYKLRES